MWKAIGTEEREEAPPHHRGADCHPKQLDRHPKGQGPKAPEDAEGTDYS